MTTNNIPFELEDGEQAVLIDGYPNYYITSHGRLYSNKCRKFIGTTNRRTGYIQCTLMPGYNKTYVHRLVLNAFGEAHPDDGEVYEVDHQDRNRSNNNIQNLHWVTHEENLYNRNPYTENRKKRLTKPEMQQFNRWYCEHEAELDNLSNPAVANRCREELGIEIHPQSVMINRGHWRIDDEGDLVRA